jgi:hypothetical protein
MDDSSEKYLAMRQMYERKLYDESQYARWPCCHTGSVTCRAMGSRSVSVPPPLDILGRMGAPDRLPPMCPVVSVVALDLLRGCDILPPPLAGCFRSIGAVNILWLCPQVPCPMALMPQTVRISHALAMAFKTLGKQMCKIPDSRWREIRNCCYLRYLG